MEVVHFLNNSLRIGKHKILKIYTDGSAHPNPGPGGFGVVITENETVINAYQEQKDYTTNNEMELQAILWVMKNYGNEFAAPDVYADSAYAINCLSKWMFNWASNGWVKSDGGKLENLEIIKEFYDLYQQGYRINLIKIKGHSGDRFNSMADGLATGKLKVNDIAII